MSAHTPHFLIWWDYLPRERMMNPDSMFGLFITQRKPVRLGVDCIAGFSQDDYGRSTFHGELSEHNLRFTKIYDENSIANMGASSVPLHYRSFAINDGAYIGIWNYANYPPTWKIPRKYRRYFIAQQVGPLTNIDLTLGEQNLIDPNPQN